MKRIDSSARFAIWFFLVAAVVIAGFGIYDRTVSGSAPLVFPAAGVSLLLAGLVYVLARRTGGPGATLLALLLAGGLASCAGREVAEARAERATPDAEWSRRPASQDVTFRNADGFDERKPAGKW